MAHRLSDNDSNAGSDQESDVMACAADENFKEFITDDVSKEEGNDTEKDTTGSEDSGDDRLYSDFLKENMEYDSKEDTDFVPSQGDSNNDSDNSGSTGTEVEGREAEEEVKSDDEIDSDDERLITLPQLQKRSHVVKAKIGLLNQMKDLEVQALQDQITFLTTITQKKLETKYKILTKMFRDLVDMENFMKIAIDVEKSKNDLHTALHGTIPKKSRRELRYATKQVEIAENVESLLQNFIGQLKNYFDMTQ